MKTMTTLFALAFSVSAMATDFSCGGTEPFWNLELKGNELTFSSPVEETSTTENVTSRVSALGTHGDFVFVVKTEKSTATIVTGECSDGMSESTYTHHLVFSSGDNVFYGCCNPIK